MQVLNVTKYLCFCFYFLDDDEDDNEEDPTGLSGEQTKEEERKEDIERMLEEAEANIEQLDANR